MLAESLCFYQGDSKLLSFLLQKQMDHNLPCLFGNSLCCYQLYSFVNTRKSRGFVTAKGFIIFFLECRWQRTCKPAGQCKFNIPVYINPLFFTSFLGVAIQVVFNDFRWDSSLECLGLDLDSINMLRFSLFYI